MKLIDPDHPFFARAWVRWATVLFPLVWAGVEFYNASLGWGLLFGAMGLYALWMLILKRPQG